MMKNARDIKQGDVYSDVWVAKQDAVDLTKVKHPDAAQRQALAGGYSIMIFSENVEDEDTASRYFKAGQALIVE